MDNSDYSKIESLADKINKILYKKNIDFELNLILSNLETSRYANSAIIQNMTEEKVTVSLRISSGKKMVQGNTSDITEVGLTKFLDSLIKNLKFTREIPYFEGFIQHNDNRKIFALNKLLSLVGRKGRFDWIPILGKNDREEI